MCRKDKYLFPPSSGCLLNHLSQLFPSFLFFLFPPSSSHCSFTSSLLDPLQLLYQTASDREGKWQMKVKDKKYSKLFLSVACVAISLLSNIRLMPCCSAFHLFFCTMHKTVLNLYWWSDSLCLILGSHHMKRQVIYYKSKGGAYDKKTCDLNAP